MGLLAADDWKADWIGFDTHRGEVASSNADFGAARWIWHAADQGADKPKGHRLFVTEIDVPADSPVEEAVLLFGGRRRPQVHDQRHAGGGRD